MKKLIAVGIIAILTMGVAGCNWFQAAEPTVEQPTVTQDLERTPVTEEPEETFSLSDYKYDSKTGELKSLKDGEVLYKLESSPENVLTILDLDGSKLIVWETGADNSPGPGWVHQIWTSENEAKNIYYLDLENVSEGLQPYTIPESKKQEEQKLLEEYINQM